MIFIAEIGMNYNGNFSLCYELIKQSKYAGADIAKFQLGWRDKPGEINQLNLQKVNQIIKWCNEFEIEPMFSIISNNAYKIIKKVKIKKIKIASRSLKYDFDLVKKMINENKKKEFIISLGMWNKNKLPFKNKNIKYLWCCSKYPTFNNDLRKLPKKFDTKKYYGYSDHTIGIEACLIAITRGAKIIEKHFTLDKSNNTIRDHALSATPSEFRNLVILGREINKKILIGV
tara:strand:- start:977 stop:1666 length:690 start_codon:yes stop_codon:yes gene_type:complete